MLYPDKFGKDPLFPKNTDFAVVYKDGLVGQGVITYRSFKKGEIIATGKGRVTEDGKVLPLEVKAGDKVLFSKYAGTELKLDGQEFLMMREEDILGVFN